jgi:hypothetical protein
MRITDTESSPSVTGRSLALISQVGASGDGATYTRHARPSATFLAQLVATAQGAPQTRARRRATADHAAAVYAASAHRDPPSKIKVAL